MSLSVFLYSSCSVQITFVPSERLLDVKGTKGYLCRSCPCLYVLKWKEPWIVIWSAGVLLSASLLALGDQIGKSWRCSLPLLLSVRWGGHCSLRSIWIYLWKVACKSKQFSSTLSCSLYGKSRNPHVHNHSSDILFKVHCTRLQLAFTKICIFSNAVFHFLNQIARDLKTINRCQKDGNLGCFSQLLLLC